MNDLNKRLLKFAVDVFALTNDLPKNLLLTDNLNQLVRASSSPGANYSEAQSASSKRDFHHKIQISLKEMRESHYWLHYFNNLYPGNSIAPELIAESEELCKILSAIAEKTRPLKP
jgi:four helix bundle protein